MQSKQEKQLGALRRNQRQLEIAIKNGPLFRDKLENPEQAARSAKNHAEFLVRKQAEITKLAAILGVEP